MCNTNTISYNRFKKLVATKIRRKPWLIKWVLKKEEFGSKSTMTTWTGETGKSCQKLGKVSLIPWLRRKTFMSCSETGKIRNYLNEFRTSRENWIWGLKMFRKGWGKNTSISMAKNDKFHKVRFTTPELMKLQICEKTEDNKYWPWKDLWRK